MYPLTHMNRRDFLSTLAGAGLAIAAGQALAATASRSRIQIAGKSFRGIFPIMATPYTAARKIDFEDLAKEVDFLERCGVHGMVWPQWASGCRDISKEDRMKGFETLAAAHKGKKTSLILGVQATDKKGMLEFAEKALAQEPDALIAMPPFEGKTLDEYRDYYLALARLSDRPVFIQTTGGNEALEPSISVEFLLGIIKDNPNLCYLKDEVEPMVPRLKTWVGNRPLVKYVFCGHDGKNFMNELAVGADGTMPSAGYSDVLVELWNAYQAGNKDRAQQAFDALLAALSLGANTPYVMMKRGVFKTKFTPKGDHPLPDDLKQKLDAQLDALKPFFKA